MGKHKRKLILDIDPRKMSNKSSTGDGGEENPMPYGCYKKLSLDKKDDFTQDVDSDVENDNVKKARRQSSTTNDDDEDTEQDVSVISVERRQTLSPRYSGGANVREEFKFYKHGTPSTSNAYSLPSLSPYSPHYRTPLMGPLYRNFQLLGDSQFVRFTKQILQEKVMGRSINYCVTGQTIRNLHDMLCKKTYNIHPFVIVLIGTNDLKAQKCNAAGMIKNYNDLLAVLKPLTKKIILLTIPPVYIRVDSINHWQTFETYNKHILQQHNGEQIFVVDLGVHLVGYHGDRGIKSYYEKNYNNMPDRPDLLHLNVKGLRLLKFLLDLHYFERY